MEIEARQIVVCPQGDGTQLKGERVVSEVEMVKRGGWIGVEMKIIDLMSAILGG